MIRASNESTLKNSFCTRKCKKCTKVQLSKYFILNIMHANLFNMHFPSDSALFEKSSSVKCTKVHKTALKSAKHEKCLSSVPDTEININFDLQPIPRLLKRKVHRVFKVHKPGVNTRKVYFICRTCKEAFKMYSKRFLFNFIIILEKVHKAQRVHHRFS